MNRPGYAEGFLGGWDCNQGDGISWP